MSVEPWTAEAAAYGRFVGSPWRAELERFFYLDDADLRLIAGRRGDRNRVGFASQLGTVRFLGGFLADPTDVPTDVVVYIAEQVGAGNASCLTGHMGRRVTRFEHAAQIVAEYGYRDFAGAEAELVQWLEDPEGGRSRPAFSDEQLGGSSRRRSRASGPPVSRGTS